MQKQQPVYNQKVHIVPNVDLQIADIQMKSIVFGLNIIQTLKTL
ncbi:hypothetical protein GCWU000282_02643 [Catonella morbi ATCC 51271]|uniref:Uncharacterized protein n=1 Tax=Catonella morbi ATCC 51271 TaxID=592026 RepID=V2Y365_9FIRM|nr:hypothetical protein GCWU000282_02643 [Catonella morbi ATCC 51271]